MSTELELPADGSIWIVCGVIYIVVCKGYNMFLAGESEIISDLQISKTLIMAIISISVGTYLYNKYNSYTPSFSAAPVAHNPPPEAPVPLQVPLRNPRLTRLVPH